MIPHYEIDDVLRGGDTIIPWHSGAVAPSAEVGLWRAVVLEQIWLATRPLAPEPEVTESHSGRTGVKAMSREERKEYLANMPAPQRAYLRQHNAHSEWKRARMEIDNARAWLLHDNVDFPMACNLAHWNPENIRQRAKSLADRGWPSFLLERPDYVQICVAVDVQLAEEAELQEAA